MSMASDMVFDIVKFCEKHDLTKTQAIELLTTMRLSMQWDLDLSDEEAKKRSTDMVESIMKIYSVELKS